LTGLQDFHDLQNCACVALLVAIAIIVYKLLGNAINDSNSITGSNIKNAKFP
jgi:hypothetical protein